MENLDIKQKIEKLNDILLEYQKAYYIENSPKVTDLEYDRVFDLLVTLEKKYPEHRLKESATQRVGSDLTQDFPEEQHLIPVLSLDKAYSVDEVISWQKKSGDDILIYAEEKIDGASIVLYYKNGVLDRAVTRGNGLIGNNVTENIKTIKSIPLKINYKKNLIVRGEIYIEKEQFKLLNKEFDYIYSNPRNLAAGTLRRKSSKEASAVPLKIFIYEGFFEEKLDSHKQIIAELEKLGFRVNPKNRVIVSKDDLDTFIKNEIRERENHNYEIDGLVFKVDLISKRESLGYTDHHPRWAIAYKFESPKTETVIENIEIQVGRTGRITPVARVKSVELNGSVISNITLHNQDYIDMLEIGIGDRVSISKRGDVIPAVEEVLEKGINYSHYAIDKNCPSCGSELVKVGAHHFCQNRKNCLAQIRGRLKFFASKNQINIEGLGRETIDFLIDKDFIKTIPDIYKFDYKRLAEFNGFKEKKISNIIDSVEKSKSAGFNKVFSALGFPEIGPKVVEIFIKNGYNSIDKILDIVKKGDTDKFFEFKGIGESTINSIKKELSDEDNILLINELKDIGLNFNIENKNLIVDKNFENTKWAITGSFINFQSRELIIYEIENRGGTFVSSISKNTTYLLCGSGAGSKLKQAETLNVKIILEQDFMKMIGEKNSEDN